MAPTDSHPLSTRPKRIVIGAALALSALVVVSIACFIQSNRESELRDAGRELRQLSIALSEATERGLESAEVIQNSLLECMHLLDTANGEEAEAFMHSAGFHEIMKDKISSVPMVDALTLIDAKGKLVNFSRYWPVPDVDVSDRDYFRVLAHDPARITYLGEPVQNRGNGTWTIYLARRLNNAKGEFAGLVLAAMNVTYFETAYSSFSMEGGRVSLYRTDGVPLARFPHVSSEYNMSFAALPIFGAREGRNSFGSMIVHSIRDTSRTPILFAFDDLRKFPGIVTVSKSIDAVLADWRRLSGLLICGAAVVVALIVTTAVCLLRGLDQQRRSAELDKARLAAELELAAQHEISRHAGRFETALNSMLHGLCMFDADGHLIVCNPRYMELYGLPPELAVPGTSYGVVSGYLANVLAEGGPGWKSPLDLHRSLTRANPEHTGLRRLIDGRTILVRYRLAPDGGCVVTHEDITEQQKAEAQLLHMARHDILTGLPNRHVFQEHMDQSLAQCAKGDAFAVHYIDLDHFKDVNDLLGHAIGDMVLVDVAQRLRSTVRDTDMIARVGGDEFAIIQTNLRQPEDAGGLAARIIKRLGEPFEIEGHLITIGGSIGIARAPLDDLDGARLLSKADIALYHAKAGGRRGFRYFEPQMDAELQSRRNLEADLRLALANEAFELYFQPLLDTKSNTIASFEALIRWNHPVLGQISPLDFIPLAEETGLIVPIGEWVLRTACQQALTWPDDIRVSVNISVVQFRPGNLVRGVAAILAETGLAPQRLELEITESVLLHEEAANLGTLHELRALGTKIVMDDFGTGYSSLNYLRVFPFDKIKIDKSFIQNLDQTSANAIAGLVAQLGKTLGMRVTAEGIETKAQFAKIVEQGFSEGQGYLFSRPVPAAAVQTFFLETLPASQAA